MTDDWEKAARALLRAEMLRHSISYKELSKRLEKIDVKEHEKQLMNKVARGKFSFSFLLQCMSVIGVEIVRIPRAEEIKKK